MKNVENSKSVCLPSLVPNVEAVTWLFNRFNESFFESALSNVVISVSPSPSGKTAGWCSRKEIWEDSSKHRFYELNICPEFLNRPLEEVCGTLLHEMVHLCNALDGIQDCSRNSLYHNKHFKSRATKHGLHVEKTEKYGFSKTSLTTEMSNFIKSLEFTGFNLFRNAIIKSEEKIEGDKKIGMILKTSSTRKYACPKCRLSIRATKDVAIICADCNELLIKKP